MEVEQLSRVYKIIKDDDLKSFSSLFSDAKDLSLCFGRFPLLSLLYMCDAYHILDKFESVLIPIRRYTVVDEQFEMYNDFKRLAKRSLKFFVDTNRIVEPAIMLAIKDEREILHKNYKKLYKTDDTVYVLNEIYHLNNHAQTNITTGTYNVKKKTGKLAKLVTLLCSIFLILCISIGAVSIGVIVTKNGLGTESRPFKIRTERELADALSTDAQNIILENDIKLTSEILPKDFSGTFDGNGKTIDAGKFLKQGLIKKLSGKIYNLSINFNIEEVEYDESFGLIAAESGGEILNCKVIGNFNAKVNSDYQIQYLEGEDIPEIYLSLYVANNTGTIKNSLASANVVLKNDGETDAYFAYFAGENSGYVTSCKTALPSSFGEYVVMTDTVDVSGIVAKNYNEVVSCENNVSISQTTSKIWGPIVSGVVAVNYGLVSDCENKESAKLFCQSSLDEYSIPNGGKFDMNIGGVTAINYMQVASCKNLANVIGKSTNIDVYVGGICGQNHYSIDTSQGLIYYAVIDTSYAECNLEAESEKQATFVGGVVSNNYVGIARNSGFVGSAKASSTKSENIGGISALNLFYQKLPVDVVDGLVIDGYSSVNGCYSQINFISSNLQTEERHFGHILGFIQANYETDEQYFANFYVASNLIILRNNYYVETDSSYGAGDIRYPVSVDLQGSKTIDDRFDGSTKIENLDDLPEGKRLYA